MRALALDWPMAVTTARRLLLSGTALSTFLTIVHATNDAFTSMLSALLPTLQLRFSLTETTLALLVATLSFSSSVTQPLFGALSDRLGRRLVASLGVVMSSSLLSLIGIVPSIYILFGILFLGGLGSAAFHPSGTSMARAAGQKNKGLVVGIFSAGGTLGLALGPVIILYVIANFGLGFTPWLMIPGVMLGTLMYFVVPQQERAPAHSRPKLFDLELFAGPVGALCVAGILRSLSFVTFVNAIPLWLVTTQGIARDGTVIGWTLATFSFSAGVGGILAGALVPRLGRRAIIFGSMLLAIPILFIVFLLPPSSPLFFLAVALSGALTNASVPLLIVTAQDLAPHAMATATGMLMGFTWGTAGVLYILIGRLQEMIGLGAAMGLSYLFLLPAALVAFYVLSRNRGSLMD